MLIFQIVQHDRGCLKSILKITLTYFYLYGKLNMNCDESHSNSRMSAKKLASSEHLSFMTRVEEVLQNMKCKQQNPILPKIICSEEFIGFPPLNDLNGFLLLLSFCLLLYHFWEFQEFWQANHFCHFSKTLSNTSNFNCTYKQTILTRIFALFLTK